MTVIQPHQQGQVRLLLDELWLVDPLLDDDLGHPQAQGGVGAGLDGHVVVGVDVGWAAVGSHKDRLPTVVARLGAVVVDRHHRVHGVGVRDHRELGVEAVVDAAGRVELAEGEVDARGEVVDDGVDVWL